MVTRRILVVGGTATTLVLALVSWKLIGETAPVPLAAPPAERGTARLAAPPAAPKALIQRTAQAVSGDGEAARAAWLQRHFGPDLNSAPEAGDDAPVPPAQPANDLPAQGTPERFELELQRTAELFPDTKQFIDEMKEDIAVAQHNSNLSQPVPKPLP